MTDIIGSIGDFVTNNPITTGIGGILIGLAVNRLADLILVQYWPDKIILDAIRKVDVNIEKFKAKFPESGAALEAKVLQTLSDAKAIIEGTKT